MNTTQGNGLSRYLPPKAKHVHSGDGYRVSLVAIDNSTVEIHVSSPEALKRVSLHEFMEEVEAASVPPRLPETSLGEYLGKLKLFNELFAS